MYNKFCYVNRQLIEISFIEIEESLNLQICLNLLSVDRKNSHYALIKSDKALGNIPEYSKFEKIIFPSLFFWNEIVAEINLDYFSLVSEEFIEKLIELWNTIEYFWRDSRENRALQLIKNNYKKYINEAKIRNIIK